MLYAIFVYAWSKTLVAETSDYGDIVITQTYIGQRLLLMHDGVIRVNKGLKGFIVWSNNGLCSASQVKGGICRKSSDAIAIAGKIGRR
ncbi:hypothetical protein TI05_18835 [Achromatium sp. WMS3]|nr:hypothetical protein TI05_18835 [Achromatium sp. WMS3]